MRIGSVIQIQSDDVTAINSTVHLYGHLCFVLSNSQTDTESDNQNKNNDCRYYKRRTIDLKLRRRYFLPWVVRGVSVMMLHVILTSENHENVEVQRRKAVSFLSHRLPWVIHARYPFNWDQVLRVSVLHHVGLRWRSLSLVLWQYFVLDPSRRGVLNTE